MPVFAGGGAAFIRESAAAIKEINEGEFDMSTTSEDGTVDVRMLVSAKESGFRMIVTKDGRTANDAAFTKGKGITVDHESKKFSTFGEAWIKKTAETYKDKDTGYEIAPGCVSINFDSNEGLIVRSNPGIENVRRWANGDQELFTGDFGKGKDKRGTFQWIRDAKTKLPVSMTATTAGRTVDVRFTFKSRQVSDRELQVPKSSYRDYEEVTIPAAGTH